jgi:hypothetical protein
LGRAGYTFPIWDDAQYNTKCSPFSGRDNPSVDASTTATTVAVPVPSNVGEMAEEMTGSPEKTFFTDVAMVGQFNFEAHPDHVIHWVKRWREVFRVVSVWGPFSPETYEILTDRGIDVVLYQGDKGYYSPLRNLGRSLVRFASDSTLQGVIIAHDDILIDVSSLEKLGFPGDGNILVQGPLEELFIFSDNSTIWDEKEGTFVDVQKRMTGIARKWSWWPNVLPTFSDALSKDPRSSAYVDASGMATLYAMVPGDFVYVPTKYAKPFHDMAEWLADNKVFLEASMITTVLHLRDRYMANVTHLETCTAWGRDRHRTAKFVTDCRRSGRAFELYHPIKISSGLETWDAYFDEMVTRNGSSAL